MVFWRLEKIEKQRNYFSQERVNKKGNFTEFVVRTYYCIYKACADGNGKCCLAKEVSAYKIKNIIYKGFYNDTPDHDYRSVIDDCVKHLKLMHYIKFKMENGVWMIYLNKPLDFLLPNEHENYLNSFDIQDNVTFLNS